MMGTVYIFVSDVYTLYSAHAVYSMLLYIVYTWDVENEYIEFSYCSVLQPKNHSRNLVVVVLDVVSLSRNRFWNRF